MIVAIYARVSTDQQAEKGYSLQTQLEACRRKAGELPPAISVEEYVDDGYSGAYLDRPALERLREGLRSKRFGAVIVYDPDRLARNLTHQLILTDEVEDNEAQLLFVNFDWQNTPEGKLFYSIRGAVSAYEREKIRERSQRGKRGKALAGKVVRNNHPYGYNWDPTNSIYTISPEEADMIRQIFAWVVDEHMSMRSIARRLAELQYPTRTDRNSWNIGTVHDIVTRETYAGTHWVNKEYKTKVAQHKFARGVRDVSEWIPVSVPAIVSRETWEAAQRELKRHKRVTRRPQRYPYICRGLVVCALCGGHMRAMTCGTGSRPYYVCKTGRAISGKSSTGGDVKCPARQIPAQDLDHHVWMYISGLLQHPETVAEELARTGGPGQQRTTRQALERLQTRETKLNAERDKVTLLFRQELIDLSTAERQLTDIKQSLSDVRAARQRIEAELETTMAPRDNDALRAKLQSLLDMADTADPNMQRQVIVSVVRQIKAQRTDLGKASAISGPEIEVDITFALT
ncbi:transposon gamma-delta resolvase [Peptococcaceae bacterium CEB3]|nr:transposon gamma-delta resolvase [Peptococcaceae bacterium CEB3]